MPEISNSILIATSTFDDNLTIKHMTIDEMISFAENDNRLVIDEGLLWLLNKKVVDFAEDLKKEPGMLVIPFQKSTTCTKCSTLNESSKTKTEYDKDKDLLKRTCRNCSHEWYEYPADHKEVQNGSDQGTETPESA